MPVLVLFHVFEKAYQLEIRS